MRKKKLICLITVLLLFLPMLTGCAGLGDYSIPLAGKYQLWRINSLAIVICEVQPETPYLGNDVVGAYVSHVDLDADYIFARRIDRHKDVELAIDLLQEPDYYVINVAEETVSGPMTASEFEAWRTAAGYVDEPQWIRSNQQPALRDRAEEANG